ncbi:protein of unknown function [Niabella drilacis]|uniref:DUF4185 domain-containing protein n=2 Tax=Niabella drilacis (strain DSM 25811 / CCM 8410 / CCUG 62505 / LMG 26954 / E90) TaxID=1285928 RepID=A0A1G6JMK2_NIADE|nr:protein of unknown function [Niabella drilacis]
MPVLVKVPVFLKPEPAVLPGNVIVAHVKRIARVTGATRAGERFPNPNQTDIRYDVGGTDLGIAWRMGNGTVGLFFGDTYGRDFKPGAGGPGEAGNWRSNILAFSSDNNLSDGLTLNGMLTAGGMTAAKEVIASRHDPDCNGEHTMIPTAAIHAGGADYVHCMNIHCWGTPGKWNINYAGLFRSTDNGKTWHSCKGVRFPAASKFAQAAFTKKDGWVYMLGTPAGRHGPVYLLRATEKGLAFRQQFAYWNEARGWVKGDEAMATPVIEAPAGEMSVIYNETFRRWIVVYLDVSRKALVLRDSEQLQRGWSAPKTLVNAADYPGLYGSFIYPSQNGTELYFLMSVWKDYNVFLMKADLKQEGE